MISKRLIEWGSSDSAIREMADYAEKRTAEIGAENVFNFSIGSPSVDAGELSISGC